jgi:hypothetical protein
LQSLDREGSWNITREKANEIDKVIPSPLVRGNKAWTLLKELVGDKISDYDMACFCLTYLSYFSTQLDELCLEEVKALIRQFNAAHYFRIEHGRARELSTKLPKLQGGDAPVMGRLPQE